MELRDYISVIRARKWVIVQAVVIVTLVALVVSVVQPKSYQATARVLITEKDSASAILGNALPLSSQPERALQTQVQMVSLRPIAESTIASLTLQTTPDELLKRITVSELGQTDIIEITATDGDPKRAAEIANTMADTYVTAARSAQRASITAAADEVQKRLEEAKAEIIDLGHRVASAGSASDLQAELQIATGTYSNLADKLEQLRINEQLETGPGRVVSTAVLEDQPVAPRPARNAGIGLVLGLVLGLGLAFLYEYLDNTIKSAEEVERLFSAPVLGTIPREKLEKGEKRRLSVINFPGSSSAEAYRVLRNSLDFINFENDMKKIMVTSAAPAEGKSTVASNLAAALAQAGRKVVLVSVDFRRPTTDQFFNVNNMVGLSDVLVGTHSLKSALQRPGDEQLLVLTSGKMPPNPSELLSSNKMHDVLEALGEWGEWVIVDAPPLLAVADPASVARWADGVLMVSQAGVSTREAGKKAAQLLEQVGAHTIGVVVWGVGEAGSDRGRYGDYAGGYYYYSSYYSQPSGAEQDKSRKASSTQPSSEEEWAPAESGGTRAMRFIGRVLTGVLAFLVVVAIAAVAFYFLAGYMGWDMRPILGLFGR